MAFAAVATRKETFEFKLMQYKKGGGTRQKEGLDYTENECQGMCDTIP